MQRVALITGGAGAVGFLSAQRLAGLGYVPVLADRDAARLDACVAELRAQGAVGIVADLMDRAAPAAIMREVADRFGRLDCLLNNAGLSKARQIGSIDLAEWDEVMQVNLTAPMLLVQAAMGFWEAQRDGCIINMGSRTWASGSGPGYTASKAGLVGLTRSLAVQLGPLGVTVNAIAPSYLSTPFNFPDDEAARRAADAQHARISPLGRIATAADVAGAVAFLASADARFISGEVIHVAGGAQLAMRPQSPAVNVGLAAQPAG